MAEWVQSIDVGAGIPLPGEDPFVPMAAEGEAGMPQASAPPEWAAGQEDRVRPGPVMPESVQRDQVPLDTPTSPLYDHPVSQSFVEPGPRELALLPSLPVPGEVSQLQPPSADTTVPPASDPPQAGETPPKSADPPSAPNSIASIPHVPPSLPPSPVGQPSAPPEPADTSLVPRPSPLPSQQTGAPPVAPAPLSPDQVRHQAVEGRRGRRDELRAWRREAAGLPPETPPQATQEADIPAGADSPSPRPTPRERHEEDLARRQAAGRPPDESELRRLIEQQGDPFATIGGGLGWAGEGMETAGGGSLAGGAGAPSGGGSLAGGAGAPSGGGSLQEVLQELRGLREAQKEANSHLASIAEQISSVGTVGP